MIVGIHHCGIGVADLERSVGFYRDLLGFRVVRRRLGGWQDTATAIGQPELSWKMAWLRYGEGPEKAIIALLEPSPRDNSHSFCWPAGIGFSHVALRVTDLANLYSELVSKGVDFVLPPTEGETSVRYAFAKDPDGNILEFIQLP